jgi:ketosteroid isomerase-like protein
LVLTQPSINQSINQTKMSSKMSSKKLETAKRYMGHFATLDMEVLKETLSEDFEQIFAPASINPPGPFDKAGFLQHHEKLIEVMSGFPVTVKEYIVGEKGVVVWATAKTQWRPELVDSDGWEYQGEYVFMLDMDESGEKITRIVEFLDSKATADKLVGLLKRAQENRK